MIEIPLDSSPEQLFSINLSGEPYDCRVLLNSRTGIWTISFSKSGVDIVIGIPLLAGVDILKQYLIPITNMYVLNLDQPTLDPSKVGLGTSSKLFILTDEEVSGE